MIERQELHHLADFEPILEQVKNLTTNGTSEEEAKSQVADSYGLLTWRQLEVFLEIGDEQRDDFDHLACLSYVWWDHPSRREQALKMIEEDPDLDRRSIYTACTTGNVTLVKQFLDADPNLLNQRGGYLDWEPLLYACYSRMDLPNRSTADVVRLLIERGANPNAYWRWGGIYVFTALTGLFGEGERGPINQPPHPEYEELTRLLLEAGADCNDSQALYNRMFQSSNTAIERLLEFGLNKDHMCSWYATVDGKLVQNPEKTLDYQLQWAVKNNHKKRVKILTEHGANVSQNLPNDGGDLVRIARVRGFNEVAETLEEHGAKPYQMTTVEAFLNHCLNGDESSARALLSANPNLIAETYKHDPEAMNNAADLGNDTALKLMVALGFEIHGTKFDTPLHHAAHNGHLALVKWLLENGADLHRRDAFYASTPLGWAQAGSKIDVITFLEDLDLGIFDLINLDAKERIESLLDEDSTLLERTLRHELSDELKQHEVSWQTPLAYAAIRDKTDLVKLLLNRGANSDLQSESGTSLADLCNDEIKSVLNQSSE